MSFASVEVSVFAEIGKPDTEHAVEELDADAGLVLVEPSAESRRPSHEQHVLPVGALDVAGPDSPSERPVVSDGDVTPIVPDRTRRKVDQGHSRDRLEPPDADDPGHVRLEGGGRLRIGRNQPARTVALGDIARCVAARPNEEIPARGQQQNHREGCGGAPDDALPAGGRSGWRSRRSATRPQ
jgi:hypothetical protein